MPNSDRDWKKWGRIDPYFGVLAHSKYASGHIAQNKEEFFLTGEHYVGALLRDVEAAGPVRPGRALDHGCGTGRLTIPLCRRFDHVVALDVAPDMLAEARANARSAGCSNIEFAVADDALSRAGGLFDLVVSHLVLQHVPAKRGHAIFDQLIDRVSPGGAFHISVSIRTDRGAQRALYWASATLPFVKGLQNWLRGEMWGAPAMQMNDYALGKLLTRLSKHGVQRVGLSIDAYHPRFQTVVLSGTLPG